MARGLGLSISHARAWRQRVHGGWVGWFALLLSCLVWASAAHAAEPDPGFAVVQRISGQVTVTNLATGAMRDLKLGDTVRVGEQLVTTASAEAVLRTDDAGIIAMRPNAKLVMEAYKAQGQRDDLFSLRILSGAQRLLTGAIAGRNRDNYRVNTPTATLGVRGTDYEPYVLTKAVAQQFGQPEGTYDKVNQGTTTLQAHGATLDVSSGQVGFVPSAAPRVRGLMTALMPVLLERVPSFYVPGKFDHELQALAAGEQGLGSSGGAAQDAPAKAILSPGSAVPGADTQLAMASHADTAACRFNTIAGRWLHGLDATILHKDAQRFVEMFDATAKITAEVVGGDGERQAVHLDRDGLARSVFASLGDLSEFSTRRPVTRARLAQGSSTKQCNRIEVQSLVIEGGVRSTGSYRIESIETFVLERKAGRWVAVTAATRQQ